MLHVFVMQAAKASAVRGIEWSTALPDADDVVDLDPPAAWPADALELAAILVSGPYQLPCLLPAC